MDVEVIRSPRRKKTSSARVVDGRIEVRVPSWLPQADERAVVDELVAKVCKARDLAERGPDLQKRAEVLAQRYGLPRPVSITWVGNQQHRWGSCTPATKSIRISSRLRNVPTYVLDYVIVHELAHLVEDGHGHRFKEIEDRFPRRERAEGFLEAMGLGIGSAGYMAE